MTESEKIETKMDLTVPISYCAICDAGRVALEISDRPCGHSDDQKRYFGLPVVPVDPKARIPSEDT